MGEWAKGNTERTTRWLKELEGAEVRRFDDLVEAASGPAWEEFKWTNVDDKAELVV